MDDPHAVRAPVVHWLDVGLSCPGCDITLTTGADWQESPGAWTPGDENRFLLCDNCDLLVELPNVTVSCHFAGAGE